jgi:HTH-type transcriptional regulator / antitoxin HigA
MSEKQDQFRTPGQLIKALLDERGWTQAVLAIVLEVKQPIVSSLVNDKRRVDAQMAVQLSEVFGVPAERFLELQQAYDLARARLVTRTDPERATRAHIFGSLPVAEMLSRGWIDAPDIHDIPAVESSLAKFFGVSDVNQIEVLPHAAKKTEVAGEVTPAQLAWLYRVRQIASSIYAPTYTDLSGRRAANELSTLLYAVEEARKAPRILAENGIRFVIVEALAGSKVDGVCMWLDEKSPVIAMSMRFDRIDNFWWVLRHELEHVIRLHGRRAIALDTELEGERAGTSEQIPEEERVANAAASEFCVPKAKLDAFIARKDPLFTERDLVGFANVLRIHPGLVAGQLQFRTGRYDRFRAHQVKVRHAVAPNALVDGWGDVASVQN